jgi:hypothetical protein
MVVESNKIMQRSWSETGEVNKLERRDDRAAADRGFVAAW